MPVIWILTLILVFSIIGFFLGRARAMTSAGGDMRCLHSLPSYYGYNSALFLAVPSLILLGLWLILQPIYIESRISSLLPETAIS